jgi:Na+-translocating ferredoxin:NAD+ oxidoreductase RnfG subunit
LSTVITHALILASVAVVTAGYTTSTYILKERDIQLKDKDIQLKSE